VALEWVGLGPHLYTAVADERIDQASRTPLSLRPRPGVSQEFVPHLRDFRREKLNVRQTRSVVAEGRSEAVSAS